MRQFRRQHLALVLFVVMALTFSTAAMAQKTTISFGVPWGLDVFNGVLLELVDAYNAQSDKYRVEIDTGWGPDKLLTAAAGGTGPDVVGVDNPDTVRTLGEAVLRPIDVMIDRYGIDRGRFLPDSVTQLRGQTYSIKMFVDPNFPLIYNETLLQESGIGQPPATISELDEVNSKLTRRSNDGLVQQLGMLPWNLGDDHLFFTWGPTFGAASIWEGDENSGRFKLATDEWHETFDWIAEYVHRLLPEIGHWGDRRWYHLDWLIDGNVLMAYHVSPTLARLKENTPYTWKVAPPLTNPGGSAAPIWFGGFTFGVGKFTNVEEGAYDFLRFLTWDERASEIIGRTGLIGAYQGSVAHQVLLENNPEWSDFLAVLPLASGNYYRPPQVNFAAEATAFMNSVREGGTVADGLFEMERRLNILAEEAGLQVVR